MGNAASAVELQLLKLTTHILRIYLLCTSLFSLSLSHGLTRISWLPVGQVLPTLQAFSLSIPLHWQITDCPATVWSFKCLHNHPQWPNRWRISLAQNRLPHYCNPSPSPLLFSVRGISMTSWSLLSPSKRQRGEKCTIICGLASLVPLYRLSYVLV